ncbi:hypothetical protein [Streptomyces eurythermus]
MSATVASAFTDCESMTAALEVTVLGPANGIARHLLPVSTR